MQSLFYLRYWHKISRYINSSKYIPVAKVWTFFGALFCETLHSRAGENGRFGTVSECGMRGDNHGWSFYARESTRTEKHMARARRFHPDWLWKSNPKVRGYAVRTQYDPVRTGHRAGIGRPTQREHHRASAVFRIISDSHDHLIRFGKHSTRFVITNGVSSVEKKWVIISKGETERVETGLL